MRNSSTVGAAAFGIVTLATGLAPLTAQAQAETQTGPQLSFGLEQRLESTQNLALSPAGSGRTTQAMTNLSFGLLSETASSSLKLDGSAVLRLVNGPATSGTDFALDDKYLGLAYIRSSADASLSLKARLQDANVAYLRPLDDFIDPDTGLIDPSIDLTDLNATGTRHTYGFDATLRWGETAPLGFGLNAGISQVSYSNASSPDLIGNRRMHIGADMRLDFSEVTKATLGLTYSRYKDDVAGSANRNTLHFSAGLSHARPNGQISAQLSLDDTPDGNRIGLSFGRDLDLPTGALSASLGVVKSANTGTELSANLVWSQSLANGQVDAQLNRAVTAGSDDTNHLVTAISLNYNRELTPLSSLSLGLSYVDNVETAVGTATQNSSFEASYTRKLTEDWGLGLGYRHEMRDTTLSDAANSNTVFLSLKRNFEFRP